MPGPISDAAIIELEVIEMTKVSLLLPVLLLISPSQVQAGANYLKPDFSLPTDRRPSILILYPQIDINRQGKGGTDSRDEAWTSAGHTNLAQAIKKSSVARNFDLQFMALPEAASAKPYEEAMEIYRWLIGEIIFKVPQGTRPIQSGKKGSYRYTFGAELSARLKLAYGAADYGLVINQYDTYATDGQILGEILGATAVGVVTPKGSPTPMRPTRPHYGNALLFDLSSGDVIWFHGDGAFGGDLRKPDTAQIRANQALTKFPIPGKTK